MTREYLWITAATAVAAFALFALLLKRKGQKPGIAAAALPISLVLGLAAAKLGYVLLLQAEDILVWGEWDVLWDFQPKRLCFVLGAVGCCLGIWLSARLFRVDRKAVMDAFAAPGALLVMGLRLAEGQLGKLGAGVLVEGESFLTQAPFTISDSWGDRYVAVFFWEAVVAAVICLWALAMREKRPGLRFEKTAFALCLCQLLLENMRNQSMRWGFVYIEQLLCALLLMGLLFAACRRSTKKQGRYWPCVGLLACLGAIVGEEFARQKGGSRFLADAGYFMLAGILAVIAVIYGRTLRSVE